ncbi:MAG: ABC transporter [bacterium]|nr:ABC transporter [bacterium]
MAWDTNTLIERLSHVHDELTTLPHGPTIEGSAQTRRLTKQLIEQVDDYLLPRLSNLDAPLLAAIGGSTGAGKSTITNSLIGDAVSPSGLLRPTTRIPVLVCHPAAEQWFREGGVLPDLPRISGSSAATGNGIRIVTSTALTEGLAVLDTPDIDSVEVVNHELASQLLGAADLWLFVTTAARYADAVPWDYLAMARERAIAMAVAINRIPQGGETTITGHFAEMLDEHGLAGVTIFPIAETALENDRIPESNVAEIRDWLLGRAAGNAERRSLVQATIEGALASIPDRLAKIATGIEREAAALSDLNSDVDHTYAAAKTAVAERVQTGALLRNEVLAGWQEYVGGGQIMRSLQGGISWIRDAFRSVIKGGPTAAAEVQGELTSSMVAAILESADSAADATVERWEKTPAGRQLLSDDARTLARPAESLRESAESEIDAWQDHVLGLVRQQAEGKRLAARTLSLGINTIGVSLMVVMFAHTGGITGGEVAVAGGTATVSQALLTALFGENAVRDLARQAHADLMARVERLLDEDAARFRARLDDGPTADDAAGIAALGTPFGEVVR